MTIKLISCIGLDYDLNLITHFIKHYSKYNINHYHIIFNSSIFDFEVEDYYGYFAHLKTSNGVLANITLEKWYGEFNSINKLSRFNKIIESTLESHILLADVDEFQNHKKINDDYIWGDLIDREPITTGKLVKNINISDIELQFPIKSKTSGWINTIKPCVFPSTERLKTSHHITRNYNGEPLIDIDHYRWTDTRLRKSEDRYTIYSRLNKEGIRFVDGAKFDTNESMNVISKLKASADLI